MKNIALVSFHNEPNYGTMLQAYALAEVIKNLGYRAEYIDYVNRNKEFFLIRYLKSIIKFFYRPKGNSEFSFFYNKEFRDTLQAFENFHSHYIPVSPMTYYRNTIVDSQSNYKSFIVGSDQTWSEFMNRKEGSIMFLDFVSDSNKKHSYAPSIGTIGFSETYLKVLIQKLSSFSSISCRERENCELLSKELKKEVSWVLDPTLLLTSKEWSSITAPEMIEGDYVLAYILGEKQSTIDFAEKLATNFDLPLYFIVTRPMYLQKKNAISGIGPSQFISLIRSAKYVVTDSFHGSMFSIINNVNFYSFGKRTETNGSENDNARISCFLKEIGIPERFQSDNDARIMPDIQYKVVNERLTELREKSIQYLTEILKK